MISHPALYQKHLYVGDRPPDVPPEHLHVGRLKNEFNIQNNCGFSIFDWRICAV